MDRQFDDYQRELDSLRFTPEQKARIAARAARAAEGAETIGRQTRRNHRPILRTAFIAAAVTVVLAVGAGAAGILKPAAEVFAPIFGGTPAQTEVIDKIGRPIGASDTDNGITITADAIIGDPYNVCVVYTITREDGEVFDFAGNELGYLPLMFMSDDLDLGTRGGSHGGSYFIDPVPGDRSIQFVEALSSDAPLTQSATAHAVFENLCVWDEEAKEAVPLAEGKWKLDFDMDYEDASVTLGGGETFTQDGLDFTIDSVMVSPVAVRAAYTVDSCVQWSDTPGGELNDEDTLTWERYFGNVEVLLTKTDGTVIDLSHTGGSIAPVGGVTCCAKGRILDQIIPLEEMASISVGGVEYVIPQS